LGCIAIAGIPPFSGFFSKDEILAAAYAHNPIYWGLGVVGAAMTAFYMFRLYATTFLGTFRGTPDQEYHLHESPNAMTIPLIILSILSVVGGLVGIPEILGGHHELHHYLSNVLISEKQHHIEHSTEYMLMAISVAIAALVVIFAIVRYSKKPELQDATGIAKAMENKWYIDELYDAVIVRPLEAVAVFFKNGIEKSGIDAFVNGVGKFVNYSSRQLRLVQSGQVGNYILIMVLSIVIFILLWFYDISIIRLVDKIF
jgi:NADH-quinone oxidoreductase subunit L